MALVVKLGELIGNLPEFIQEAASVADQSWNKMDMIAATLADEGKKLSIQINKRDHAKIYRTVGWLIGMAGDLAAVALPPNRRGKLEAETKAINRDMKQLYKERGDKMWFEE